MSQRKIPHYFDDALAFHLGTPVSAKCATEHKTPKAHGQELHKQLNEIVMKVDWGSPEDKPFWF